MCIIKQQTLNFFRINFIFTINLLFFIFLLPIFWSIAIIIQVIIFFKIISCHFSIIHSCKINIRIQISILVLEL